MGALPKKKVDTPPRGEGTVEVSGGGTFVYLPREKEASDSQPDRGAVLTKAVFRSAACLDLSDRQLAKIIGVSEAFISRLRSGKEMLEDGSELFRLSALFVRAFCSLYAIVGGNEKVAREWMRAENSDFGERPIERMVKAGGLADVVSHLDAHRAP